MCDPIIAGSRTFAATDIEIKNNKAGKKILFIMLHNRCNLKRRKNNFSILKN